MLQPIERSCTDNGIETTVVAAMNDNDMVDIYVEMCIRDRLYTAAYRLD